MANKHSNLKLPLSVKITKRLNLIKEKKKLVIGMLITGLLLAALASILLPKLYRATGRIIFKYNSVNSTFLINNGSLESEFQLLKSNSLLKKTVKTLAQKGIPVSVKDISESEKLIVDKDGTAIDISIVSDEAGKSAEIINTLTENFSEICILSNRSNYISAMKSINERDKSLQQDIRKNLASQQGVLTSTINLEQEQLITQISEFESELESLELDNYFYSSQLEYLQKVLEQRFPVLSPSILLFNDDILSKIKLKLERLETQNNLSRLSQKLANFTVQYPWEESYNLNELPSVRSSFNRNIERLIDKLSITKNAADSDFLKNLSKAAFEDQITVNAIDLTKSTIFNILTNLEDKFNRIPFSIIDVVRQLRIKQFNSSLAIKIKAKKIRLQEKEKNFLAEIESVRKAEIPNSYFSPNLALNMFWGALIGLLVGLLIAAASSDARKIELIKSTKDIEEAGYKIISQIPSFPTGSQLLFDSLNNNEKKKLDPKILNSFASIETFLKYGSLDKELKTVLITSSQDNEGKSVVASNVAIALANNENKVLLVDADLKHPQLSKYFRIKSTPSLAHYLFRKKELYEIIRNTHNKNLDIITCIEFPQNPSVIITSERMKNFMTQVKENYDYIVYDSTSLYSLKETAKIANSVDEVILVVRANKTKLTEVITAEALLNENGVYDFNVVLNDLES